ncbi:hypothetical protein ACFOG5_00075 [Pedobacter fastidiosus]
MLKFKPQIKGFIFLFILIGALTASAQSDTAQHTSQRKNSLEQQKNHT